MTFCGVGAESKTVTLHLPEARAVTENWPASLVAGLTEAQTPFIVAWKGPPNWLPARVSMACNVATLPEAGNTILPVCVPDTNEAVHVIVRGEREGVGSAAKVEGALEGR